MNKLYTEEQVRIMLAKARFHNMDDTEMFTDDYLIEQQTPIQLPSDEEIKEEVSKLKFSKEGYRGGVIEGMMWMRDKIKGGQGE